MLTRYICTSDGQGNMGLVAADDPQDQMVFKKCALLRQSRTDARHVPSSYLSTAKMG